MGKITRKIIKTHSPDWYSHRSEYIGSSEIGAVMGLSSYKVAASLFLQKIGLMEENREPNQFMMYGIAMEDIVAKEYWQHYNPMEPDQLTQNFMEGNIIRTCRKRNGYVLNSDYPFFSSSPDRIIDKSTGFKMSTGEMLTSPGILEIKTINQFEFDKWDSVPPEYIAQVMQQLTVCEYDYAEIALLSSDKSFHVFPIEFRKDFSDGLVEYGRRFHNLMMQGKKLKKEYDIACLAMDKKKEQEILAEIDKITPLPAPGQERLYEKFLNERYLKEEKEMPQTMGDYSDIEKCKEVKYLGEMTEYFKSRETELKNELKKKIGSTKYMVFEDDKTKVTYKTKSNGSVHYNLYLDKNHREEVSDMVSQTKLTLNSLWEKTSLAEGSH